MDQYVVKGKIKSETMSHDTSELFHFLTYLKNNQGVRPALTVLLSLFMSFLFSSFLPKATKPRLKNLNLLTASIYMINTDIESIGVQYDLEEIVFH